MNSPKLAVLFWFLFIIISKSFAQIDPQTLEKINTAAQKAEQDAANLPANEKKVNAFILDRINTMIKENAGINYYGMEMVNRYSIPAARVDEKGRIKIRISMFENTVQEDLNNLLLDLENQDAIILNLYFPSINIKWQPEITCFLPYEKVKNIAKDNRIANISICSDAIQYAGEFLTQGDTALHADVARNYHDVDGGRQHLIKVGVISDGIIGFDTSQASYDLPYSLTWLSGHNLIQGKEGRAMLEIVHDLAPGALLMFGSSRFGDSNYLQMINTIDDLISFNCDIIVDDVGFPDEPWFLDGALAQEIWAHIDGDNIIYVSSAGNNAKKMWTGLFMNGDSGWLDFYHQGTTANIQNRIFVFNEDTVHVYLQWQDNWQNAENNYDLYVFDQYYPSTPVGSGGRTVQGPGNNQKPLELVTFTNNTGTDRYYNIQVKKVNDNDANRYLKVWVLEKELQYTHPSSQGHAGEQLVGHAAANGVISVAAYPYFDDTVIEDFSSLGPTILRDEWGSIITRYTPTITATDGVETSVSSPPWFNPFYGTSASAPHIAGIAALYFDKFGTGTSWQNFYNDLKDNADNVASGTGGTWNYFSGYGKANAFEALGGGPLLVTVDQQKSNGASIDSIHHWENSWIPYKVPKLFPWEENSDHVLKAEDQELLDGQKYHDWDGNKYLIFENYHIDQSSDQITTHLLPAYSTVVKNDLTGANGGTIEIKDPWFIDYNDPTYGMRNRGLNPIFHSYSSPINLTLGSEYKGIFLNQSGPTQNWEPPYYSVRAQQNPTIPLKGQDREWYFTSWSGTNVQFQYPNQTETAVVFQQDSAVAKANFKGHLVSSSNITTLYNSQRKMVYDSGIYHLVYEDNGEIYYTSSSDDGGQWSDEILISDGGGFNRYPSIASINGIIGVTWQQYYNSVGYILFRMKYAGSWEAIQTVKIHMGVSSGFISSPVLVTTNKMPFCFLTIWRNYDNFNPTNLMIRSYVIPYRVLGNQVTIPNTNSNSCYPSVAEDNINHQHLTWQESGNIYYKWFDYHYDKERDDYYWAPRELVSSGTGYFNHKYPCITIDFQRRPSIIWEAYGGVVIPQEIILYKRRGSNWNTQATAFIGNDDYLKPAITSFPYISYNNELRATWTRGSNLIWNANYNGSSWTEIYSPPIWGLEPNLSINLSSTQASKMVYRDNTSPYFIVPTSQRLDSESKEFKFLSEDITISTHRRGVLVFNESEIAFELGDLNVDGTPVQFTQFTDTLTFSQTGNWQGVFCTQSFTVSNRSILHFSLGFQILNRSQLIVNLPQKSTIEINLKAIDSNTHQILAVMDGMQIGKIIPADTIRYQSVLWNLPGTRSIYLKVSFELNSTIPLMESLVECYYENITDNLLKPFTEETLLTNIIPSKFDLYQNYPNPFNPTTTISFDLPKDVSVLLEIFDITGCKICTLVNEPKEAGTHQVIWNGQDDHGNSVASGLYVYRIQAGDFVQSKKLLFMK